MNNVHPNYEESNQQTFSPKAKTQHHQQSLLQEHKVPQSSIINPIEKVKAKTNSNGNSHSNSSMKHSKKAFNHGKSMTSLIDISPNKHNSFENYLISPTKDYRFKESAFTPLKDSLLLFTPSMKLEGQSESPFEKCDYYSTKKKDSVIQGKCIDFNNLDIDISPEQSENHNEEQINERPPSQTLITPGNNNNSVSLKIKCTCTKTYCKKKYCACYANGQFCDDCECENCDNKGLNNPTANNKRAMSIICNCTKSNCTKKYCECYKNGKACSSLCRCINCINCASFDMNNNPYVNRNNVSPNCLFYTIESAWIEISNNVIYIKDRLPIIEGVKGKEKERERNREMENNGLDRVMFNEDTYTPKKMIGRKRTPWKMNSTNVKTPGLASQKKRYNFPNTNSHNKRSNRRNTSNKKIEDM